MANLTDCATPPIAAPVRRGMAPTAVHLALIAAGSLPLVIAAQWYPRAEWVGDLRLLLFLLLLLAIAHPAIRGYLRSRGQRTSPVEEAVPSPVSARPFPRLLNPWVIGVLVAACLVKVALLPGWVMIADEGLWNYVAYAWTKFGLPPYIGSVENKTPGIFYLFALSNHFFGVNYWFPRLLGIMAQLGSLAAIYAVTRRLAGHLAGVFAVLFAGFAIASHLMEGGTPSQTESFLICFNALAVWLMVIAIQAPQGRRRLVYLLLAGASLGMAIVFKQIAILSVFGLLGFYLLAQRGQQRTPAVCAREVALLLVGVAAVNALSLVPLLLNHVTVRDYWQGAWLILTQPGSSAPSLYLRTKWGTDALISFELQTLLLLALLSLLFWRSCKQARIPHLGLLWWALCEFVAINSSGTYFGHQLKQMVPPFAILGGITVGFLVQSPAVASTLNDRRLLAVYGILLCLWWPSFKFPQPRAMGIARERIGQWIAERTTTDDYVYVFSTCNGNPILATTGRRSSSRQFNQHFIHIPGVLDEIRHDMRTHPPKYVVVPDFGIISNLDPIPLPAWAKEMLATEYRLRLAQSHYEVYERLTPVRAAAAR